MAFAASRHMLEKVKIFPLLVVMVMVKVLGKESAADTSDELAMTTESRLASLAAVRQRYFWDTLRHEWVNSASTSAISGVQRLLAITAFNRHDDQAVPVRK
ncbi:hypothetical protein ACJQWK_02301 [Exserohilum turcicum]|uniref:Uncharacterized protein n=1 Tax=Exserohilum turcicum (strain 28A) TaxID=671987 RepID=R0IS74_EXST2|nr:uncharacterized protein SETTUDRAFT_39155 [Exserohilum turcica Et28A]EOA87685.1 hypothetical protein SETTUDRAFT_39155 [Exserohilum turcica Et28A]